MNKPAVALLVTSLACLIAGAAWLRPVAGLLVAGVGLGILGFLSLDIDGREQR